MNYKQALCTLAGHYVDYTRAVAIDVPYALNDNYGGDSEHNGFGYYTAALLLCTSCMIVIDVHHPVRPNLIGDYYDNYLVNPLNRKISSQFLVAKTALETLNSSDPPNLYR